MPINIGIPGVVTVNVPAPGLPINISVGVTSGILDTNGDTSPTPTTDTPTPPTSGSGVVPSNTDTPIAPYEPIAVDTGDYTYFQGRHTMLRYRKITEKDNAYCVWLTSDPDLQQPDYCIVNPPIENNEDPIQAVLRIVEEAANL